MVGYTSVFCKQDPDADAERGTAGFQQKMSLYFGAKCSRNNLTKYETLPTMANYGEYN